MKSDSGQLDSQREGGDIKGIDQLFFPLCFSLSSDLLVLTVLRLRSGPVVVSGRRSGRC